LIFYLFIDGVGFGKNDLDINPFTRYAEGFFLPLANKSITHSSISKGIYLETDASMGIPGLPQSATGQTAIWTGINAPQILQRHISGFPSFTLRKIINDLSIVKILDENQKKVRFLNAYSPVYFQHVANKPKLVSASTMVQLASKLPLLTLDDIREDKAIFMDINHEFFIQFAKDFLHPDDELLNIRDPYLVGKKIMKTYSDHDLVLFEYFLTDKMGHDQNWDLSKKVISTVEKFIEGLVDGMSEKDQIIITSDHGNLEDLSTNTHTKNKVPCYLIGNYTDTYKTKINTLADIVPCIYNTLDVQIELKWEKKD
jgi:hypothetical protein